MNVKTYPIAVGEITDPNTDLTPFAVSEEGGSFEFRPYLSALEDLSADAPGAPYNFGPTPGQEETPVSGYPLALIWTELVRLRRNLFAEAEVRVGGVLVGYKPWAMVSDPVIIHTVGNSGGAGIPTIRGAGEQYPRCNPSDVEVVIPLIPNTTPATTCYVLLLFSGSEETSTLSFVTKCPNTTLQVSLLQFYFELSGTSNPSSASLTGTGLSRFSGPSMAFGTWNRNGQSGRSVTVSIGLKAPIADLSAWANYTVSFQVSLNGGGAVLFRRVDYSLSFNRPISTDVKDAGIITSHGTYPPFPSVRLAWKSFTVNAENLEVWRNGVADYQHTAIQVNATSAAAVVLNFTVLRGRTAPRGNFGRESICSLAEVWKRQDRIPLESNLSLMRGSVNVENLGLNQSYAAPWFFSAKSAQIRSPDLRGQERWWKDEVRSGASWPEYQSLNLTIPADAVPSVGTFNLPALRIPLSPTVTDEAYAAATTCEYFKIPIPPSREVERIVKWFATYDSGAPNQRTTNPLPTGVARVSFDAEARQYGTQTTDDPFPVTTYPSANDKDSSGVARLADGAALGTAETQYFHDARLTDSTGSTFWYRDLVTLMPDVRPLQNEKRFRHWFIAPDGDGLALFLLRDKRQVQVGWDQSVSPPTPIFEDREFFPTDTVTESQYKAAYGTANGQPIGNWTEFNHPVRIFSSSPSAPIALWTVGKKPGPRWEPGMSLTLHLPKAVKRSQVKEFGGVPLKFLDVTPPFTTQDLTTFHPARFSELYDFEVWRYPHKREVLTLRNGSAKLSYQSPLDLRVYAVNPITAIDGGISYARGREINNADYRIGTDGTLTVSRLTGSFPMVMACYQTRKAVGNYSVQVGNMDSTGTFTPYKDITISKENTASKGQRQDNIAVSPFIQTGENGDRIAIEARWIIHEIWAPAFKRIFADVEASASAELRTVGTVENALLVSVTVPEDATLKFNATYKKQDGSTLSKTHTIAVYPNAPKLIQPDFDDATMVGFEIVSCVQNFQVRVTGREIMPHVSAPSPEILGTPMRAHYNETLRLLKAYNQAALDGTL